MPRFAANLSMLFTEMPMAQRFSAAATAGFRQVELQFPYELTADELDTLLTENQLRLLQINLPAGNWAGGERGIACHPDRTEEFRRGVEQALSYAKRLGIRQINCLSGIRPEAVTDALAAETFISNISFAADRLNEHGIALQIEAINTQDIPGFYLNNSTQAFDIIDRCGRDNLYFQYDVYHMQIMEGNLITRLRANLDKVSHIQIADVPGRHEPGTGEINFPNLFKALDAMGYSGAVSLEYIPEHGTLSSLGWLSELNNQVVVKHESTGSC
ncbi:hydroxypyruvate isomerase [Marinobacterium jannaschii]|uniref:hydroxypyruvate isomerase n=1 Tax=Marinobacterium jannaschii TaxID=64970 RepID=UPI000482A5ED|nr:hydroxypyruvate isomerase [Marinobacterium jannaschii]